MAAEDGGRVPLLVADLRDARAELMAALDEVDPALLTAPGLVGEWSARELVAHLGYWAGHATETIHAAERGDLAGVEADGLDVDARNATVARVAREADLATVRQREAAAFETLVERLTAMDAALLDALDADGDTLEAGIRDDGPDHYREHLADVRAWFGTGDDGDED
jgi:hypothetical protein